MPSADGYDSQGDAQLFALLGMLRAGREVTRPELIAETGLGRRVVTQRIDDLVTSGLVSETATAPSTGGRPPAQIRFRPEAGVVLVADISPATIRVGCCDLSAQLHEWSEYEVDPGTSPEDILDRVEAGWDELAARRPGLLDQVVAVGIGVIGPVDSSDAPHSIVVTPFGWDAAHVRHRLVERYGVPVWVDDAVNMMAVGEYRLTPRDSTDLILVLVDDGIGAALIMDGHLLRGTDGIAGELGHVRASDDPALVCWCGRVGCLSQVASGAAIERATRQRSVSERSSDRAAGAAPGLPAAIRAARAGDPDLVESFRAAGDATGRVLAGLVTVLNPSEIVMGGRVPGVGDIFLEPLRQALRTSAFPAAVERVRVSVSTHEAELGLVGAAIVAIDGYLSPHHAHRWLRRAASH